jgi:seryl-tRNA synthetase
MSELRRVGTPRDFKDFKPKQLSSLVEALGSWTETAAKLSGSRFVVLKGPLARLERALSIHARSAYIQSTATPK